MHESRNSDKEPIPKGVKRLSLLAVSLGVVVLDSSRLFSNSALDSRYFSGAGLLSGVTGLGAELVSIAPPEWAGVMTKREDKPLLDTVEDFSSPPTDTLVFSSGVGVINSTV